MRRLLEGSAGPEADAFTAHLESCRVCQEALEGLTAACPYPDATRATIADRPVTVEWREKPGDAARETESLPVVPGYELLGRVGRGGMGVVYKAWQVGLRRVVALKMAAADAGDSSLARFRVEAEAVARLAHANIVPVFEVGEYDGRPVMAMEFVEGGSLAGKLAGSPLPPRDAARLVELLARAAHYAHGRGVLHRDITPGNVLLAADGTPKLTDFGLAKLLAGGPGLTRSEAVMGTPSYMPPEQAAGNTRAVGPASDVYSLGAVLYECLTGRAPFRATTPLETLALVTGSEPVPPRRLQPGVPRDLQTICLKCLRKEPAKRYNTAESLADDLGRFLDGRPVVARPVGPAERLVLWARRRPALASLAASVMVVAVGSAVLLTSAYERERQARRDEEGQRRLAEDNERKALASADAEHAAKVAAEKRLGQIEKANDILASIFKDLNPREEEKGGITLREQIGRRLDLAAEQLDAEAVGDPLTVARLQDTLASSLTELGYAEKAIVLAVKALRTREEQLGPDHPDTLAGMNQLALSYRAAGQLDRAIPLYERVIERHKTQLRSDHADALKTANNLAVAYHESGRLDLAIPLLEQTYRTQKAKSGDDAADTLTTMGNLALGYRDAGQLERAVALYEEAVEALRRRYGPDHSNTLTVLGNLAVAYHDAGRTDLAVARYEEVLKLTKAKLGAAHPDTVLSMNNLAEGYRATGRLDLALPLLEEAHRLAKVAYPADHPKAFIILSNLVKAREAAGDYANAPALHEELLKLRTAKLGPEHPDTLSSMSGLALAYRSAGRLDQAQPLAEQVLKLRKAKLGPEHPVTLTSMSDLAVIYGDTGQPGRALPLQQEVLRVRTALLGPEHPDTLVSMSNLAAVYVRLQKPALAVPLLEESLRLRRERLGPDHPDTLYGMNNLADCYIRIGRIDLALPIHEESVERMKSKLGPDHPDTLAGMSNLGNAYKSVGRFDRALQLHEESYLLKKAKLGADHPDTILGLNNWAATYWSMEDYAHSIPLLEEAYRLSRERFGANDHQTLMVEANLGVNYRDGGRPRDGLRLVEDAVDRARKLPGPFPPQLNWLPLTLAETYDKAGRYAQSEPLYREHVADTVKRVGAGAPGTVLPLAQLGFNLLRQQKWVEAEGALRECLTIRVKHEPDAWSTFQTRSLLGWAMTGQRRYAEAEPLLLDGYAGLKHRENKIALAGKVRVREAAERLVRHYEAWGQPAKAAEWREKVYADAEPIPRPSESR
jgi:lipopolysaccharide biosynthesis regulator YciM